MCKGNELNVILFVFQSVIWIVMGKVSDLATACKSSPPHITRRLADSS